MAATHLGYGIFVRFRRSRLPLRRGIARLEDALALAEKIRAERFHKQEAVFVVKEPEGIIVTAATLEALRAPPSGPPAASEPAPAPLSLPPPALPAAGGISVPVALDAHPTEDLPAEPPEPVRPLSWSTSFEPTSLRRWTEQLQTMQRAIAQARRAQARLESAYAAAGSVIRIHGGAPEDPFVDHHERLGSLCDATRRMVASVERSAEMVERQLQVAWAGAGEDRAASSPAWRATV